ncbi:GGDEF domain-containing protein [Aliiglaciecola sp. LCG003]|uniref:GGDEF domain-containing protein n=1 Tax=Aliiglaciecola sp. LCG003 TaxID=3053655 RepID=UPI0025746145|nr:GGDEF domain-containing protein [Aliiglaciecola sp. LCG003]WJG09013.1 GGDEF domain-containing protein [Aliiglaciecola sp. LCG003]
MSLIFPKPHPAFEVEYEVYCNNNNLKYVMYFSFLACIVFGIHLIHHFRLGMGAFSTEMMPYTLLYSFAVLYSSLNIFLLNKLKDAPALIAIANFIELVFPFFMASLAVMLSVLSAEFGLGVTPFAIIMMTMCFTLHGQFVLLSSVVAIAFWVLSVILVINVPPEVYSPLIAISLTTTIACLVICNFTEQARIRQFETFTELTNNNKKLKMLSQQDHLTGLLNRRTIDNFLERELSRSERFNHSLSLLIIDIDDFKLINDSFGHVFGDRVLVEVADAIKKHVRDIDYVGRIGGDEFIVILVETAQANAMQVADRMRGEVFKLNKMYESTAISISVGHGLSEGESHIALIEKADKALYQAKKAGKNKVRSISSSLPLA